MWFYPVPALIALVGWIYVAATPDQRQYLGTALILLLLGLAVYFLRANLFKLWPFEKNIDEISERQRAGPLDV
jgi:formate hydrogenlyase subunit 3/multisubunit Na+/H+ antiporter MnhD subunit